MPTEGECLEAGEDNVIERNCLLQKFYYEELPVAVLGVSAGELTAFTDTVSVHWLSPGPVHSVLCIRIGSFIASLFKSFQAHNQHYLQKAMSGG